MSGRSDLYDPPAGHQPSSTNDRIAPIQQAINEAAQQMHENTQRAMNRGERLDTLQYKSDNLNTSSQGFARRANQLRKNMWWKDMRMRICIVVAVIILLVVIIVPAVVVPHNNKSS